MENVAICCVDSFGSCVFDGSWFCIWATNIFRKPSLSRVAFGFEADVEPLCWAAGVVVVPVTAVIALPVRGSGEDVDEDAVGQDEGGLGDRRGIRVVAVAQAARAGGAAALGAVGAGVGEKPAGAPCCCWSPEVETSSESR